MIRLQGVNKSYREADSTRPVLADLTAEFRDGAFTVVRGRSGSGKSTLLNLLGGIDLPDSGEILIDDCDLARLDEQARTLFRRNRIGFVFQAFNLVPTLTVFENLAFPLELTGRSAAEAERLVADLLCKLDLAERADSFPDQLSGGEQQRIAIGRAVVHMPTLILADEPSGNLDQETEQRVIQLLRSLPTDLGITVICATHSREIAGVADEIFELRDGRLYTE